MSESNGFATPESIFKPLKRRFTDIEIDGFGKFRIQTLTTSEGIALEQGDPKETLLRVIIACCVDGNGNQVFCESDVERMKGLPAEHISALGMACNEYGGLSTSMDAVKNLSATRGGSLP